MKFQVSQFGIVNPLIAKTVIVEAKNAVNAAKLILGQTPYDTKVNAKKAPKRGENVYGVGSTDCCEWQRVFVQVTEVIEVVEVAAEPTVETYVAGLVKTFTIAKLTEIITEYADAKVRAYQVLYAGAKAELATR